MTPLDGLAVSAWLAELAELGCWWPVVKGLVWRRMMVCGRAGWPGPRLGAGLGGRDRGGGAAGDADRLEKVVAGSPEVEFKIGFGVAVVEVAAEAGEQLGEDGFDHCRSPPVEGLAFGGGQAGGHLLPGWLH